VVSPASPSPRRSTIPRAVITATMIRVVAGGLRSYLRLVIPIPMMRMAWSR
jgi:hypothetical protein